MNKTAKQVTYSGNEPQKKKRLCHCANCGNGRKVNNLFTQCYHENRLKKYRIPFFLLEENNYWCNLWKPIDN